MNTKSMRRKWLLMCMLSTLPLLLLSGGARAEEWSCIHGNSGHIEFGQNIVDTGRTHIGWGLDFTQKSGLFNWVHFAVPTRFGQSTDRVALQFLTGSVDAIVNHVHIYDLGVKVGEFNNVNWTGGLQEQILVLGAPLTFTALGISIGIGAGVESLSHRFWFSGACANAN